MMRALKWATVRESFAFTLALVTLAYAMSHGIGCAPIPVPGGM